MVNRYHHAALGTGIEFGKIRVAGPFDGMTMPVVVGVNVCARDREEES